MNCRRRRSGNIDAKIKYGGRISDEIGKDASLYSCISLTMSSPKT
ncbi:9888_t:CDS:2 [Gigaspora rosea]|nr:9888_t:CDS:2 [Gigaspora rosea]